jgi:CheY-like chemotaxis protein
MARVLIVEDNADDAALIRRLLDSAGHVTVVVGGAQSALWRLARESFDLVLCDLNLVGMDGCELAVRVKAEQPGQRLVAMTAYDFEDAEGRAKLAGFEELLPKGLPLGVFLARLSPYLGAS